MTKLTQNIEIVYTMKMHAQLHLMGFEHIGTIPNPQKENLTCWIYEKTPEFIEAFNNLRSGGK